jgi:uncharacterized membrane protein
MSAHSWLNAVHFLSLAFVAICLGPALAHLLALPNKIALGRDDYFTVQQIYRGWALLGIAVVGALLFTVALAWMARHQPPILYWVLTSLVCLVLAQAVFWIFTFPANTATNNWTVAPENWSSLRVRWEYSHAVGAVLTLSALAALILALMARTRAPA